MKIAYLALGEEWRNNSAGHSHSFSICKGLAGLGNDVELFIRGRGNEERHGRLKISFINLPKAGKGLSGLRQLQELNARIKNFDIVHERFSVNPLSILARSGFKGKVILEVNDPGIETWQGAKKVAYSPLIKLKLESCNAIITQTETIKKILEKQTGKPVFVVSNAAGIERIKKKTVEKARKEMKCGKKDICVLFAGSFREWHGVHLIPEIAKRLSEKNNIKFVLIGKGELLEKVKEKSRHLKNIEFLGGRNFEEIPVFLKAADILIAPFVWKNKKFDFWWSPLKLYEYLAAGKPIVSSRFKEVEKIVKDSGLLAVPEGIEVLASLIERLAVDRNLRQRLGKKALKIAKMNSWDKKAEETIKVYERVID